MVLLSGHRLQKSYGARPLWEGLTFAVEEHERIGLIGPNGAGKSTLMQILAGELEADAGQLSRKKNLVVGYLPQTPRFGAGANVGQVLNARVAALGRDLSSWSVSGRIDELHTRLELPDRQISMAALSGGWQKRVALAAELACDPELLLLDEPTNHLDVDGIQWLERVVEDLPGSVLTITHDRLFLQRVAQRIFDLDPVHPQGLLKVDGDYATYLEIKAERLANQTQRELSLKNTLRREMEWLRRGAKARTTKQQARIQRTHALSAEVSELSARNRESQVQLGFGGEVNQTKQLLEARGLAQSYGGRLVFEDLDLIVRPKMRIGILGANGSGKSTLLRTLLGQEEPARGEVLFAKNFSVNYFEQDRESLDSKLSLLRTLCPHGDQVHYQGQPVHIRTYLARFLFAPGQADMAVGKLSGGEQARVLLARLMLRSSQLLVLDEPTNDLDVATLDVLGQCLMEFPGAILLVTHDRYFLDQVATQILAFAPPGCRDPHLQAFANFSQWEAWYQDQLRSIEPTKPTVSTPTKPSTVPDASRVKSQKKLEQAISTADRELEALRAELNRPELATNAKRLGEISAGIAQAEGQLQALYERWADLEA